MPQSEPRSAGPVHGSDEPPETTPKAYLNEVFLSFQGEGLPVGQRQIFVRLAGCDIRCPWCDTPDALVARDSPVAKIETRPNGPFEEIPNPVEPEEVVRHVARLREAHGPVSWVSLTGGEPTIWRRFLVRLCPLLKGAGFQLYLETNSHHPDTLAAIAGWIDFVSADLKLPFSEYGIAKETYAAFLAQLDPAGAQVKVVVQGNLDDDEVLQAVDLVAAASPELPLVLQPVTPIDVEGSPLVIPSPEQLLRLQGLALTRLSDVRIIPQTHRTVGVR